jgi:hypothetical protein
MTGVRLCHHPRASISMVVQPRHSPIAPMA